MIFDDVLSVLNNESKKVVLDILNDIKEKHTIIIISKEDSIMNVSDNVILLDEGLVVDSGEYDVIKKNKLYKKIVG